MAVNAESLGSEADEGVVDRKPRPVTATARRSSDETVLTASNTTSASGRFRSWPPNVYARTMVIIVSRSS